MSDFIIRTTVDGFCLGVEHVLFAGSYLLALILTLVCIFFFVILAYAAIYAMVNLTCFGWRYWKAHKTRKKMAEEATAVYGETHSGYDVDVENLHYTVPCDCGANAILHVGGYSGQLYTLVCPKCGKEISGETATAVRELWEHIHKVATLRRRKQHDDT